MTTRRVAGILGLVSTVGIMAANSAGQATGTPAYGAKPEEWGDWLAENPLSTSDWGAAYAEVLVLCGFLVFFAALWGVLRRAEGEWNWLATAALGAGLVSTTVKLASGPIAIVAFDRNDSLSPDVQTALIESNGWSFVLTFAIDGVFLLCAGALIVATRVLPRWIGWLALPLGVLCMLSVLGGYEGFPGILLFFLWVIVTSVYLIVRPRPAEAAL